MLEYLPYLVLAGVVGGIYLYRRGIAKTPSLDSRPVATEGTASLARPSMSSVTLYAMAQAKAREEANDELDRKFAESARAAAIATYNAPFSPPSPEGAAV